MQVDLVKEQCLEDEKKKSRASKPDEKSSNAADSTATIKEKHGSKIYSLPALYDLAFGYRNFESEVDFLVYAHQNYATCNSKNGPHSIIELAAGPARHSLTALSQKHYPIKRCHAVDISADMADYSQSLASEYLATNIHKEKSAEDIFSYSVINMKDLSTLVEQKENGKNGPPFDSAWMLLGSMQHLLSNEEAITTFQSIGSVVEPGGTLILELPHPRELFQLMECTRNGWEVPLEGTEGSDEGELRIIWGDDNDVFNPISQQRDFTVELKLVETNEKGKEVMVQNVKEVVPMRLYTAKEIDLLASASGCWTFEKMYGALDEEVDVEDDELAFRMVCVLKRI